MNPYLLLAGAILAELVGMAALNVSPGLSRPGPTLAVVAGYGISFYLMSLVLEDLPVGLVYGVWSAVGIVGIALIGVVVFDEGIDLAGAVGMGIIIVGVVVLTTVSEMSIH